MLEPLSVKTETYIVKASRKVGLAKNKVAHNILLLTHKPHDELDTAE